MLSQPESHPVLRTRKQSAEEITRVLARFPLIVEILGELGKAEIPLPGDEDIRHGCERALTSMLRELGRLEPAPPGKFSKPEETVLNLMHGKAADRLINPDQFQRIQQFVERILDTRLEHT